MKIKYIILLILFFYVKAPYAQLNCPPPTPISPTGMYWSVDAPTFVWQPITNPDSGCEGYLIRAGGMACQWNSTWIVYAPSITDSCLTMPVGEWLSYFPPLPQYNWYEWAIMTWNGTFFNCASQYVNRTQNELSYSSLQSPANNETNVTLTPSMSWGSVTGAVTYQVSIYNTPTFLYWHYDTSVTTTGMTLRAGVLSTARNYWWKVKPYNSTNGQGPYSDPFMFKTTLTGAPAAPNLISPTNGSNIYTLNPTLDWDSIFNASTYTVQIASDSSFSSIVYTNSSITNSFITITSGLNYSTYYWRVKAVNSYGSSPWSSAWHFTITTQTAPPAPNLVSPPNNSTGQSISPLLEWDSAATANHYHLQVSKNSNFISLVLDSNSIINSNFTVPHGELSYDSLYYWRVSGVNNFGQGAWSVVWNFRVASPPAPGWQPDVRLTNNPSESATSLNYAKCIASSGDILHAVWYDARNAATQFYYKRSSNGGTTWGADIRLSNSTTYAERGGIAVNGQNLNVVWQDLRNSNWEIYYKRSADGGLNWGLDTRLTTASGNSWAPDVSVSGSFVHVFWTETRDGNVEAYYKRSTDNGITWGQDVRLTNNTADSWYPTGAVSGSTVHVFWSDTRDGHSEVYYKRSTDAGLSWGQDIRITNTNFDSKNPSADVNGLTVHIVWCSNRDGNPEIYYKRSTDGGLTWGSDTRLTIALGDSDIPSIAVSGSLIHVTWEDTRDTDREIYYRRSTNGGLNWEAETRLTNAAGESHYPSICYSGTAVHVVWFDGRDGNREIYYKRNPTGNIVSIKNINNEIPDNYTLYQNYPNPFNPSTKIKFDIPPSAGAKVITRLVIYDVLGKEIAILVNDLLDPGTYEAEWDGSNCPSGIYFYKLITKDFTEAKKMILLK